jgi:sugar phosphate isomerase/epimerase
MEKIDYKNKGIMLDLSHLILTASDIENIEEASDYILSKIENLGDAKSYIKGVHINDTKGHRYKKSKNYEIFKEENNVWDHIVNLDQHLPFRSERINKIIELVNPDYKVIEVKSTHKEIWEQSLEEQMRYLK